MERWEALRVNHKLLFALKQIPEIKDWNPAEIERFIYFWADP
jgi:hypothetical protein